MNKLILTFIFSFSLIFSEGLALEFEIKDLDKKIETQTWFEAMRYCKNLEKDGFKDWRLPSLEEIDYYLHEKYDNFEIHEHGHDLSDLSGLRDVEIYSSIHKNFSLKAHKNDRFIWTGTDCECQSYTGIKALQIERITQNIRPVLKIKKSYTLCVRDDKK